MTNNLACKEHVTDFRGWQFCASLPRSETASLCCMQLEKFLVLTEKQRCNTNDSKRHQHNSQDETVHSHMHSHLYRYMHSHICKQLLYDSVLFPSVIFPSVLWHCWFGNRKGIRPVKKLDVGLLVVMIWLELCTTYCSSSPVVTTASIILCFNKHWLTQRECY